MNGNQYNVTLEIDDEETNKLMQELDESIRKASSCIQALRFMGFFKVKVCSAPEAEATDAEQN